MRLGRPLVPLELTTEEQMLLESWARRRTTAQALALRDATHWSTRTMAKATGMSQSAVSRM